MEKKDFRIIFFGTPDFAAISLETLILNGFNIVATVTAPDKPAGRGMKLSESAVKTMAIKHGIPVLQPEKLKSSEFQLQLEELKPDLGIVIAFRMLPETVWSFPKLGTINLHASLLPQYRGAAPIQHAIIQGEKISGLSIFFLKHEIDTGDIIASHEMEIGIDENAGSLHDRMMKEGAELVCNTVKKIIDNSIEARPQINSSTLKTAPKLNREFCKLDLTLNMQMIHNKVRGLSPYPGAWINSKWGDMKILETRIPMNYKTFESSTEKNLLVQIDNHIGIYNKELRLNCSDGWLEIISLQLPGKTKTGAKDFLNGLKTI